jgi:ornithine lipid hydroxylase
MTGKKLFYLSSLLILPFFYVFFYFARLIARGQPLDQTLKWEGLLLLFTLILLERVYTYKYAVSQRALLARDIIANVVNKYVTAAVTGALVLPILLYVPQHYLGRKYFLASPAELGPFWLQILLIVFLVSFFRYWMHRFQHSNEFLWRLHSYHHRVSDLQALNTDVSNPVDFALRNVVVFLILGVIGFDPLAILVTLPATGVSAAISHWGADVNGGVLNYVFVTPEVHRWHHTAKVPEAHKYSVNYGVEFIFWDILFGTFHLPQENGRVVPPERIGHPGGLPDEPNYAKLLLVPFGLYRPLPWFKRARSITAAE